MQAKRRKGRSGDHATVELHFLWNGALVSGAQLAALNATGLSALSTRFLAIADAYVYFRYKSLRFRLHPANSAGLQVGGFVPVVDTSPSTTGQVAELISSMPIDPSQTTPTEWVSVRKEELAGPFPWYKVISGTPDTTEEYPGQFILIGSGTDGFTVEFRAVVELKEGVATANTPDEIALVRLRREQRSRAALVRERAGLLAALTGSASPVSGPGAPPPQSTSVPLARSSRASTTGCDYP